ncbi:MAG: TRAM domain-containing protein [Deltaproteobacteria bacterium]|nr:TRAM domain-containing protein [Deltaproteobacteria bacterium]
MMGLRWAWLVLKILLFVVCSVGGYFIADQMEGLKHFSWAPWAGLMVGIFFALLALSVEKIIKHLPLKIIFGGTIGLVSGLFVAKLIGFGFAGLQNNTLSVSIYVVLTCIFGYIGMVLGSIKIEEIRIPNWSWLMRGMNRSNQVIKILDTSVIIDGRIADIVETGFMGGVLVIPEFVLQELQHIADSPDPTRRVRGRRGLDIIKRLQQENMVEIRIDRQDFDNLNEVDAKLVALALRLNAKIVTNDYNLSKVAEVQGIRVLNINQLANALKPVVLPGEILRLQILKEGKEHGQGIAYLEDGTMVVVENASRHLGKEVDVSVTSILQTTAGRLIFTTLKDGDHSRQQH